MFVAIYRWRLRPALESQFADGWEQVTRAIYTQCGSHGSRLHKCADGTWLAYARWPAATRDVCDHQQQEGRPLMREATGEAVEDIEAVIFSDLLHEPSTAET
jgi:hypothetical protein